ncbi:MAG TPA: hypothetical protein VMA36_16575, partial [Candidatus Limnocylindria bacterium]|nr:hypothetical protein [Candidatus Limnocylindria bacterium]
MTERLELDGYVIEHDPNFAICSIGSASTGARKRSRAPLGLIVSEERVPEGYGDPARAFSFSMNNGTPYPWTLARWGEPLAFIDFYANAP